MSQVNLITISLSPPYPIGGIAHTVVRLTGQDKVKVDTAADHMGISKSALMRVLLVKGAEKILEELGVTIQYEQNHNVDLSKGETLIE